VRQYWTGLRASPVAATATERMIDSRWDLEFTANDPAEVCDPESTSRWPPRCLLLRPGWRVRGIALKAGLVAALPGVPTIRGLPVNSM
jgi:hypothetical protein